MPPSRVARRGATREAALETRSPSSTKPVPSDPMPSPPTNPFSLAPELYPLILAHCSRPTLAACLRVSQTFFDLASPLLYRRIAVTADQDPVVGIEVGTRSRGNRKIRMLDATRSLEIHGHNHISASRQVHPFPNLQVVKLVADKGGLDLCTASICPITAACRPHTLIYATPSLDRVRLPGITDQPLLASAKRIIVLWSSGPTVMKVPRPNTYLLRMEIEAMVLFVDLVKDTRRVNVTSDYRSEHSEVAAAAAIVLTGRAGRYIVASRVGRGYRGMRHEGKEAVRQRFEEQTRDELLRRLKRQDLGSRRAQEVVDGVRFVGAEEYVKGLDDDVRHAMGAGVMA